MAGSSKHKAVIPIHEYFGSSSEDEKDRLNDPSVDQLLNLKKLSLGPKKKLLILDINGLLCHRIHKQDASHSGIRRRPDAEFGNNKVYKRPFCDEFIKFCFDSFEVGIWSSAMKYNLNSVLEYCFSKGLRSKLLFVWDQDHCTNTGFDTLEKKGKPIFLKELKKIWETRKLYSASNTLLIDDTPYKALLNPPHTAIFPAEYKADMDGDDALGPNGELRLYLTGLAGADDVPSYVSENSFGKPAITLKHSDWSYYNKIIRKYRPQ